MLGWLHKKNKSRARVGLCLNSCYFGFFAHAGFVLEMSRAEIKPLALSGCSAGAIVAGCYAAGMDPDRMTRLLLQKKLARHFFEWKAPTRLVGLLLNRVGYTGLLSGKNLRDLLNKELGHINIEDCFQARLAIAVANMTHQRQEYLKSGPLADAILASCAVPGMFRAQDLHNQYYWDGGIADPVPLEPLIDDDTIDTIIVHLALNRNDVKGGSNKFRFWQGIGRSQNIIHDELFRLKCELARRAGKQLYVIQTMTPRSGPHRLNLGPQNVLRGRQSFRSHYNNIKKMR